MSRSILSPKNSAGPSSYPSTQDHGRRRRARKGISGIPRPRWPAAVSPLSILPFLEVLDAVLIRMAPVSWPASGHPAGLVRGSQPPAVAAGPSIPLFQGVFRCLGTSRRIRGALRAFS